MLELILTIILLAYAFFALISENALASPFLAPILIFFVWSIYQQKSKIRIMDKKFDKLNSKIDKLDLKIDKLTAEKEEQGKIEPDQSNNS